MMKLTSGAPYLRKFGNPSSGEFFAKALKIRVKLIFSCTRTYGITFTNFSAAKSTFHLRSSQMARTVRAYPGFVCCEATRNNAFLLEWDVSPSRPDYTPLAFRQVARGPNTKHSCCSYLFPFRLSFQLATQIRCYVVYKVMSFACIYNIILRFFFSWSSKNYSFVARPGDEFYRIKYMDL